MKGILIACVSLMALLFCVVHQRRSDARLGNLVPPSAVGVYRAGESMSVRVGWLHSVPAVFPIAVDAALPTLCGAGCNATLAEMLWSGQRMPSRYVLRAMSNVRCKMVAEGDNATTTHDGGTAAQQHVDALNALIEAGYRADLWADGLAARDGTLEVSCNPGGTLPPYDRRKFQRGYPIGVSRSCNNGKAWLHNHLDFRFGVVRRRSEPSEGAAGVGEILFEVVRFYVTPRSIVWPQETARDDALGCTLPDGMAPLDVQAVRSGAPVRWSYSVAWEDASSMPAPSLTVIEMEEARYASLVGAWMIVMVVCVAVFAVGRRIHATPAAVDASPQEEAPPNDAGVLRGLLSRMRERKKKEERELQSGWRATSAFVFCAPAHGAWVLAALVGAGAQLGVVCALMVAAGCLRYVSLDQIGAGVLLAVYAYAATAPFGGWVTGAAARCVGAAWVLPTVVSGGACPLMLLCTVCSVDGLRATATAQQDALVEGAALWAMGGVWLFVVLPLHALGGQLGASQKPLGEGCAPCPAPDIPQQKVLDCPLVWTCSVPCFSTIVWEGTLLQGYMWRGVPYSTPPLLLLIAVAAWPLSVAMTSTLCTVHTVARKNYQWWWTSFLVSGCLGVPVAAWAAHYYHTQMALSSYEATLVYAIYVAVLSTAYGIVSGAIGVLSSILFLRYHVGRTDVVGEKNV